jgi:alpha-beta hydrolase superfamily lysophospholipase
VSPAALTTADGVRLAARWWHPASAGGEAVVVVHGFCGTKEMPDVELVALRLAAAGHRVLTFDLRGHGRSEGHTTLGFLERLDVDAAVRAARADHDMVVVVGASMGGVATIDHLASAHGADVAAVVGVDGDGDGGHDRAVAEVGDRVADGGVVVGTPARWQVPRSVRGVLAVALTQTRPGRSLTARRMGTRVAVRPGRGLPPMERMAAVSRPVAVVHGLDDRFVTPLAAHELFGSVAEPRLLDLVPGMGHGFCAAAADPVEAAVGWVVRQVSEARLDAPPRGRT